MNWPILLCIIFFISLLIFLFVKKGHSDVAWNVLLERGLIAYRDGRMEDAVKHLEAAFKLNSNEFNIAFCLGNAYSRLCVYEKAIKFFKLCSLLKPDVSEPHSNTGNCYVGLKNFSSAVREYKIALELNPNDRVAKINLPAIEQLM